MAAVLYAWQVLYSILIKKSDIQLETVTRYETMKIYGGFY